MTREAEHIVRYSTFFMVWVLLLFFTAVTVIVSRLDLRPWNIWIALGIASAKAALVILIFMHLKYERWLFKIFFLLSLITLAIFIGFVFFDVLYR